MEKVQTQVANYAIIYEPIDHADTDRQVIKRIARTGQLKHCFIYRFITKKSVEERIMEFIQEGKELFQSYWKETLIMIHYLVNIIEV